MQKKIIIKSVEQTEQALLFYAENTDIKVDGLKPRAHMLVDSDNLAFLYILENEQEYVYVSIPHTVWPELEQMLPQAEEAFVEVNGIRIPVPQLKEELSYLVENIEGNANYGEELERRVAEVFLQDKSL